MKYLKSYKLFESIDIKPFDESIFQELIDEGATYTYIPLPDGHFCVEIKDCEDEILFNKAIKKLNMDVKSRYSKVREEYYIFDMGSIDKFKYLIEDLKMTKDKAGDLWFKEDGATNDRVLIQQGLKSDYCWVKYDKIWSVFESYFNTTGAAPSYGVPVLAGLVASLTYKVNQGFMSNLIEEVFGFRPLIPSANKDHNLARL
jgi:hypothetical protein